MADWKNDYEKLLIEKLKDHGIKSKKTALNISKEIQDLSEFEWEKYLVHGQIVDVVYPKIEGEKLIIKANNENGLPVEIGEVSFFDDRFEFKKGIICPLKYYNTDDDNNRLEWYQPIILIESEVIPQDILDSKIFQLKTKASVEKVDTSLFSCISWLIIGGIIGAFIWVFILS